jgi:hypothetical protein
MQQSTFTRALIVALVQHGTGGKQFSAFNTDNGLAAACGPNFEASITLPGGQYVALPQTYPFSNAADVISAKQADGDRSRVKYGWSDTPEIGGVRNWHEGSASQAMLYGHEKGTDPRWDEQLPGALKWLILVPDAPAAGTHTLFTLVMGVR